MSEPRTVFDVVEEYIRSNRDKYDGLCDLGECGCKVDDLAPCGHLNGSMCVLGHWREDGMHPGEKRI